MEVISEFFEFPVGVNGSVSLTGSQIEIRNRFPMSILVMR